MSRKATSGSFKKGTAKGKPYGAINKVTQSAREIFTLTLEAQAPFIADAFEKVRNEDPAHYLEIFAKYAQYFIPKKVEVDASIFQMPAPNIIAPNGHKPE